MNFGLVFFVIGVAACAFCFGMAFESWRRDRESKPPPTAPVISIEDARSKNIHSVDGGAP